MQQVNFDRIFRNFYQKERQRSEDCIGSIINAMMPSQTSDEERLAEIVEILIRHYDR